MRRNEGKICINRSEKSKSKSFLYVNLGLFKYYSH